MLRIIGKSTSRHIVQYGQFVWVFLGLRVLRNVGKSTSRHLVQYGQLVWVFLGFWCAKNYW